MNTYAQLACIKCGEMYPLGVAPLSCPNHSKYYSYLSINYQYDMVRGFKENTAHVWEKYLPLLPVSNLSIHFNETKTPLIHAVRLGKKLGIPDLWIKDEGKNPTGSFKDKESIVSINMAKEFGLSDLLVVSSGNAAVSTAAYAQKADCRCVCIVPKNLSVGKRFLLGLYGATITFGEGSYEDLYRWAIDEVKSGWNMTPGLNPYKEEGIKIIGFEIWEEIGVPDIIIVPCGNGTLLFGLYKAFWELKKIGKSTKIPMFIGVQVKGAAPLAKALSTGADFEVLSHAVDTIAEGIIATESYSSPKALMAIKNSGGSIIEVTDEEIHTALRIVISTESLIPEPTSAAAYAGLAKIGKITDKKVVVIQTALGMKNLKEIMESYLHTE